VIVLDTNVVSAFTKREVDPIAQAWLDQFPADAAWITAINLLEIEYGIERERDRHIKDRLRLRSQLFLARVVGDRVLSLNAAAAAEAGRLRATRESIGRTIDYRDAMIAAIVAVNSATLVTRNTKHFAGLGVALINPWDKT
jgi:predicted nucleic acid-binding protein